MEVSKKSGKLLISGLLSPWIDLNRSDKRNMLTEFHRFTTKEYQFVASSGYSNHSILIDSEGRALSMGQNKQYECGQPKLSKVYIVPTEIPQLKGINMIQVACGHHHSLFLSDEGKVYACGDNSKGQCGVGATIQSVENPRLIKYDGPRIVKIDCGDHFSVILDADGNMYAFGLPEFGQLGNNTDGQYFITATKLSFNFKTKPVMIREFTQEENRGKMALVQDVRITDIACGKFHTIAVDTQGRVFTWGFGGQGQLGHNSNKNEYRPRLVKYLVATNNKASMVYTGVKSSVILTVNGDFFMWGERHNKNILYPQQDIDLIGLKFNLVACSTSTLATTDSHKLIVWGSAAHGELGIGNNPRSSAAPMENIDMKEMKIVHMALGRSHSMILVDTKCKVTKEKYVKFPEFKAA